MTFDRASFDAAAAVVGEQHLLSGREAERFAAGGVPPPAAALPGSRDQVAALLRLAAERGWAVVPYGGGTLIDQGFPPSRLDLVIGTARLDRVVDYQPDDLTVTVEPGLVLARLEELLRPRRQFLPLNPPLPDRCTAGGTVAAAAAGPWRAAYGTPRDWLIGCRVADGSGEEVRGGGQVVKNVAGYDLPKLYSGSFGTLGILTELTFKVMPYPGARGRARLDLRHPSEAEALAASILDSDLQPAALVLAHEAAWRLGGIRAGSGRPWSLHVEFIHAAEAVAWQLARLAEMARGAGAAVALPGAEEGDALSRHLADLPVLRPFCARAGTASSAAAELAGAFAALLERHSLEPIVFAHAATGHVYAAAEAPTAGLAAEVRALAAEAGGSCVFERLPPSLRGAFDPWGEPGPEFFLMRGIKEALDPAGIFSPGRFLGRL